MAGMPLVTFRIKGQSNVVGSEIGVLEFFALNR